MNRYVGTLLCLAIMGGGCANKVNRENVFANTETGVGIIVGQNAKTQMYELKLGYVRHELFWVPTSKTIGYHSDFDSGEKQLDNIDASKTPQVLAEIMVDAKIPSSVGGTTQAITSFGVRQKLAIGAVAVGAPAASVLMAEADSKKAVILADFADRDEVEGLANKKKEEARQYVAKAKNTDVTNVTYEGHVLWFIHHEATPTQLNDMKMKLK